jgi:hypothetical protein
MKREKFASTLITFTDPSKLKACLAAQTAETAFSEKYYSRSVWDRHFAATSFHSLRRGYGKLGF